ncbi:hypothetical protein PCASD_22578 [Puccinia coronata f. sp. avenae]|uniref:Uncharacterized protein n=1 Tax=Puccinia coronata f. sp. avenae TaxID=200324 RepID=A0A2N5SA08_9BASI|nr:hypothetical protein PCASD_22578 [Puccinia coronata f. sp. avenae]
MGLTLSCPPSFWTVPWQLGKLSSLEHVESWSSVLWPNRITSGAGLNLHLCRTIQVRDQGQLLEPSHRHCVPIAMHLPSYIFWLLVPLVVFADLPRQHLPPRVLPHKPLPPMDDMGVRHQFPCTTRPSSTRGRNLVISLTAPCGVNGCSTMVEGRFFFSECPTCRKQSEVRDSSRLCATHGNPGTTSAPPS